MLLSPDRPLAPALIRRAFFMAGVALALTDASAQRAPAAPEVFGNAGRLSQAEGRRILEEFRTQGIAGQYYLSFQLRVLPVRGAERTVTGRLWGTRNAQGDLTRVSLDLPSGEQRLLIQNGARPGVWNVPAGSGSPAVELGEEALLEPLAGTDLTPFDLLRSFLYWTEVDYQDLARVLGRPAHTYLLKPPAAMAAKTPSLAAVRVYLDSQYQALVKTEYLGPGNRVAKSMSVLDLKKLESKEHGEQWIVKSIDLRNEATRNKTRFQVTGAALNQAFPASAFTPAGLAATLAAPAGVTRIDP
jgi:hypothetical protein